ncbi:efflux RND transporter periplasmic adaptor subunit [Aestuariibacter sp. AA17]|uniref:Efflux RND transporter periplasmic adaptor subunit n=1 Tax=Fluctibacter corallii TaxID=2984329 RepID=A0ABT3A3A3_9ALTE|nr:efflux RND transporter periplasmic adaptor subunit [Aestuariibacter sp. AA17]MCV2883093.1 efflux RND transporter periplasmic adaptor subunit [Aestuariibacter sp. AA17]
MRIFTSTGLFLLGISLVSLLSGCSSEVEVEQEEVIRPVKLYRVQDAHDDMLRSFPAVVEANQGSFLAFRVSGELVEFPVLAGQEVKKGALLAKLDPEDFVLQVEDRKARYELARTQLERIESLRQKGIASESEYDQAKANAQVAEAALKKAQTDLQYTELRAPFDGTVARVFVKNFESIQAKQNILRLENRDLMDVTIQIPEKLVARVKKDSGYNPTVVFDGYPDLAYELSIKEWDTTADKRTLTYRVVFTLPVPEEFNLLAGMTGSVFIDLSKVTTIDTSFIRVPVEAVFSTPTSGESRVWKYDAESQSVSSQPVVVGELLEGMIEIKDGLKSDDVVVAAGVHTLANGMKVRPYMRERGL